MKKYLLKPVTSALCAMLILASCSEEAPEIVVTFPQATEVKGAAFDEVMLDLKGFRAGLHTLQVNGVPVQLTNIGTDQYSFVVPFQCGSGKIEVVSTDNVRTPGPDFEYLPTYVGFVSNYITGTAMTGASANLAITYDPYDRAFYELQFSDINLTEGLATYLSGVKTKTTLPSSSLAVWKVGQDLGIATHDNFIYFSQLYRIEAGKDNFHTPILFTTLSSGASGEVYEDPAARYIDVFDIEVSDNDEIFTLEANRPYIRKNNFSAVTKFVGSETAGHVDGTGTAAKFESLNAMVMDANGNLYIADKNCIRKVTSAGVVTTLAGSTEEGNKDGNAADARFKDVRGIFYRADGTIYIADHGNNVIKTLKDGVVKTLAGTSAEMDDEAVTIPLYVDSDGVIYLKVGGKYNPLVVQVPEELSTEEIIEEAHMMSGFSSLHIEF